jgi:hypothetical protein
MLRLVHRQVQRRPPALVGEVGVGAAIEQQLRQLVVAVVDRREQRRPAVLGRLVDVGAGVEQLAGRGDVALARGKRQRREATTAAATRPGHDDFTVVVGHRGTGRRGRRGRSPTPLAPAPAGRRRATTGGPRRSRACGGGRASAPAVAPAAPAPPPRARFGVKALRDAPRSNPFRTPIRAALRRCGRRLGAHVALFASSTARVLTALRHVVARQTGAARLGRHGRRRRRAESPPLRDAAAPTAHISAVVPRSRSLALTSAPLRRAASPPAAARCAPQYISIVSPLGPAALTLAPPSPGGRSAARCRRVPPSPAASRRRGWRHPAWRGTQQASAASSRRVDAQCSAVRRRAAAR